MGIIKYPMGHWGTQLGPFIKTKSYKLGLQIISERVNREITNFHLLRWCATKVVKVVVCARSPILLISAVKVVVHACYRAYFVAHVFGTKFCFRKTWMMMLFRISVQLSVVEPLIAHPVWNSQHA